jgi:hypothetical protein
MIKHKCSLLTLALVFLPYLAFGQGHSATGNDVPTVTVKSMRDPQWMSYQEAFKAIKQFDNYEKPKDLLKPRFVLHPAALPASSEELRLQLVGESTRVEIPLDAALRAVIPVNKNAYKEGAEFVLNRPKGSYKTSYTIFIVENPDNIYRAEDLRNACAQAFEFLNTTSLMGKLRYIGKKCAGVRFLYPISENHPVIKYKESDGSMALVSETVEVRESQMTGVIYRFSGTPKQGEVITETPPIGIGVLIE